ncbi:MAG: ATP-binding cassette domain-containing protein [Candidatus Eisenbacteria bacterium]|nr:ATP-binding cassette domain-containing protein [Candidatus Eisenbacteria bacterium]
MAREPVILVRDLVKRFDSMTAVDHVSFEVERGEIFGLLGPNGAGKTTTISVLSCLTPPTSGEARVCGMDVTKDSLGARSRIGVVPQEVALYPSLSARENLAFWGRMYGVPERELRERIDGILETVQLASRASDRIDTFSGGMKRRVNIAAGLLHRPDVLFLDEPTVGIDPQTRRNILELVLSLNADGLTVLYTTHYLEEAEFLCQRIGIMDEGRMIAVGTRRELTESIGATQVIRVVADGLDADAATWFKDSPDIDEASVIEGKISIHARVGANLLPTVVSRLSSSGASIHSVEVDDPNLESVFLHLTGKSLRENDQ